MINISAFICVHPRLVIHHLTTFIILKVNMRVQVASRARQAHGLCHACIKPVLIQYTARHFCKFQQPFLRGALSFKLSEPQGMDSYGPEYGDYARLCKLLIVFLKSFISLAKPDDEVREYVVLSEYPDSIFQACKREIKRRFLAVFFINIPVHRLDVVLYLAGSSLFQ